MIIGIGNDICDIRRIEKTLTRFGARFEHRVFTEKERLKAVSRWQSGPKQVASTYAKRFAAKEACAKALGLGVRGISWRDMEITNLPSGAPTLVLQGRALARLQFLTPEGKTPRIWLTLTDEYPYAQAMVVIEAN